MELGYDSSKKILDWKAMVLIGLSFAVWLTLIGFVLAIAAGATF